MDNKKRQDPIKINRTEPDLQECKIVILHVINQAIKDYQHFREKDKLEDIEIYESAKGFLFDDEYVFAWGEEDINLRRLCDAIELDLDWLRNQVVKRFDLKFNLDGTIIPDRRY